MVPCILVTQGHGGPVIPQNLGSPFCRLLRLAGIRWRYFIPPPHGDINVGAETRVLEN
jgi:hypothetical protein